MQEVTHFRLPGLLPILKNTVQFVNEVRGHPKSHITICGTCLVRKVILINALAIAMTILLALISQCYRAPYHLIINHQLEPAHHL